MTMNRTPEPAPVEPMDPFNRQLLANVHPPEWVNPSPAGRYNLVVVGAGTAGLVAAAGAAGLGAKVALVERHLLGGDCLNVGCVPSKAMIRSARAAADLRRAPGYGMRLAGGAEADFPAVMERLRRLRSEISAHDSAERFRALGVDLFLGAARFAGADSVEVEGRTLRFARAVLATGARAAAPDVPGLAEAGFLTNETVFNLTQRPVRLAVVGAGPLGCELAQALARLGSRVSIIERGPQFLSREDPDAAALLAESFRRDGIETLLNTRVTGVTVSPEGKQVHLESGGGASMIVVDEILVAAGRAPNVEGLNLEAAGVAYDARSGVTVNDLLQTSNPRIYAAGDVCLKHKFTHTADASARIVIQNALFLGRKRLSALTVPWCTYTDPEIAHVGFYERDAREQKVAVDTFMQPMAEVDRALLDGEPEGFVKVHVAQGTDRLVGATVVARHAGEMISELTLALVAGAGLRTLADVIHPYPTQAEAIRKVADAYNRTRLTPFFRRLATRWLAWRRSH